MDAHIRALRKEELLIEHDGRFDEENAERVVSWLVAAENRSPVILVGAGFTLNARDRHTGSPATRTQAPLWSDVVSILAKDLGVCAGRYDAPTLFEMYREHLKEAKLRDALRAMVADSELTPGAAHEALIAYPSEAIVTTNCLDTLLDKACGSGWRRVVVDEDLSMAAEGHDLIYLHGHRHFSDSWVMTRSQYEDFPRKKPVMVARVRQLLAQHPWLVLGFGMTDPNFHAITRLVGLEMRAHQPLSLALMRGTPLAAERLHWHGLGFEIASPAIKDDFGAFLAWVIPKLVTTYSPSSTAAKEYIRRGTAPTEKLRRFRDVHPVAIVDRDEAYNDWKGQLEELLSPEERSMAKMEAAQRERSPVAPFPTIGADSPVSGVVSPTTPGPILTDPLFHGLDLAPKFRALGSFEEVQWLSILLSKNLLDGLAEHFAWGLTHQIFEDGADELPLEVIAIRLATRVGWKVSDAFRLRALLRAASASARKYGREQIEELVKAEAVVLELPLPSDEDHRDEPHLQLAQVGYRAIMNAEFLVAAEKYGEAARLVGAQKGLLFEEWAYTVGQADAVSRLVWQTTSASKKPTPTAEEDKRRLQEGALRDRVKQLEKRHAVERWVARAAEQSRSVLQEIITRSAERERFRARGGWGKRFGGNGHALWKSFRDLEIVHAPPSLRRQYLEPLLPLLNTGHVALVLPNASKPREWIDELLAHSTETFAERQKRDRELVAVLLMTEDTLTRSEIVARVECLRELKDVFRKEDIPKAFAWLERSILRVPDQWGATAWGHQAIGREYWPAFSAAAKWAAPSAACDTANYLIEKMGTSFLAAEEAVRALYDLPWHTWEPLECATAKRFLHALTGMLPNIAVANARRSAATGHALFALLRMVEAGLPAEALGPCLGPWKGVLATVKEAKASDFGESKRAGFLLERKLASLPAPVGRSTFALFEEWFGAATGAERDQREEEWAALADVIDDSKELIARLRSEVTSLLNDERALQHYELNPYRSYQAVVLLAKGMKYLPQERAQIGSFLVRLLAAAPNYMRAIAEAVVREWWEAKAWSDLMSLLVAACGGGGPAARRGMTSACPRDASLLCWICSANFNPRCSGTAITWSGTACKASRSVQQQTSACSSPITRRSQS